MRRNRYIAFAGIGVVVAVVLVSAFVSRGSDQSSVEPFLTAPVSQGNIERKVTSTGTLEAVITVQVGSQVSGRIKELNADFNSIVKKGQVLAIIDPANYEARLEKAEAALATTRAGVENAQANVQNREAELKAAQANLEVAKLEVEQSQRQLTRFQQLWKEKLVTEQDLEDAQTKLESAQGRIHQLQAQIVQSGAAISSAKAQLGQSLANVQQAEADLNMAKIDLAYTNISSPIDGVVIERNVDIGQTVAATLQAPVLFLIANDLTRMRAVAQVDEADIGSISENADAVFTVDSFPNELFKGRISEIRLGSTASEGTSNSNVVVYNVIVEVENPTLQLRPGMTATIDFTVAKTNDALLVPNSALRFVPKGIKVAEQQATGNPARKRDVQNEAAENGVEPVSVYTSTEQYGIKPGPKIHFPDSEAISSSWGTVWVLDKDGQPERRNVLLGVTDGIETAILDGELQKGEPVIIRQFEKTQDSGGTSRSPFGPAMPGRRG